MCSAIDRAPLSTTAEQRLLLFASIGGAHNEVSPHARELLPQVGGAGALLGNFSFSRAKFSAL